MPALAELDLPQFDPTDPTLRGERFHRTMAEVAEQGWLAHGPLAYTVLDREAATFFLRSKAAIFPGLKLAEIFGVEQGPLHEQMVRNIINVNGADHRRLRNLVNPAFTPRAADRFRPQMRHFLAQLFADVAEAGSCEFVEAFAKPYPSLVIATVMGAPLSDAPRLYEWSNWIQRQFDAHALTNERERIEQAVSEFYEYADRLLEQRRADPGDDVISTLLAAEQEGDRLSDAECVNLVLNALVGGVDTTQSQLAHAVRLLAEHPDQWELLAREPDLVPGAVEEVLRFEPITPFTARMLVEDVEYRDVRFPAGTLLLVSAFNANRDIDGGGDAAAFDICADRGSAKPLTFGAGIHYCLGANLARAELQEALTFLPARMRELRLDGEPEFDNVSGIYGLLSLPIRFSAGG